MQVCVGRSAVSPYDQRVSAVISSFTRVVWDKFEFPPGALFPAFSGVFPTQNDVYLLNSPCAMGAAETGFMRLGALAFNRR